MRRPVSLGVLAVALASPRSTRKQVPKGQMPTLGRPTQSDDQVPLLDFDAYFVGKWTFEWSMPETALAPAGDYTGTTVYTKVDGRFYEAVTEGQGPAGPFTVRELIAYHRENKTVARQVTDSRGTRPDGVWSGGRGPGRDLQPALRERAVHVRRQDHPPEEHVAAAVAARLSRGGQHLGGRGPFTNLGNPWWRKNP